MFDQEARKIVRELNDAANHILSLPDIEDVGLRVGHAQLIRAHITAAQKMMAELYLEILETVAAPQPPLIEE